MISSDDAIQRLKTGNLRHVSGQGRCADPLDPARRRELQAGQEPFAVIIGCADSRVPIELVFDQQAGDLFVIRVAGNIAGASQVGSIEFAVNRLGPELVVVLGHTECGAILAAIERLGTDGPELSPELGSIIDEIRPVIEDVLDDGDEEVLERAVRANIHHVVNRLRQAPALAESVADGLLIVGAEYSIETGQVEFLAKP